MRRWASIGTLLGLGIMFASSVAQAAPSSGSRRIAVLVGANAAPAGRRELRFAQDDARRLGEVLRRSGGFAADDVHLLLEPSPRELANVLASVAAQIDAAADTLFVFYYSGHSDGQALFPHGETLSLSELRELLQRVRARVRVGVLDTCRGGTWTQAKDLSLGPPLPAADLAALSSEGTVLVAASSGFENAHEAESVRGSFFTHHFTAGLLGAADSSGDGRITVQEAYEYSRERTVRDSARYAPLPQHPSFDVELRGRQDVVLTQVGSSPSALELVQNEGPLEVLHLASGLTVAELAAGARQLKLSLPPGRYLVRRVAAGKVLSREVVVPNGGVALLTEQQLEAPENAALAMKGGDEPAAPFVMATSLPARWFELRVALGLGAGPSQPSSLGGSVSKPKTLEREVQFDLAFAYAFTDRFTLNFPFPAVAYRIGERGAVELVPRIGLVGFQYVSSSGLRLFIDAGASLRLWTGEDNSLIASISGWAVPSIHTEDGQSDRPLTSGLTGSAGYGLTIHNVVSLYPGIRLKRMHQEDNEVYLPESTDWLLELGAVLELGYRSMPLVQVHVSPTFSFDAYASIVISLDTGYLYDRYLVGISWIF